VRIPETNYKCSNSTFFVTSIVVSCGHLWPQLLELFVQPLRGSPGTLVAGRVPGLGPFGEKNCTKIEK